MSNRFQSLQYGGSSNELFHGALDYTRDKTGNQGIVLKEAQYEAIKSVVVEKRDTICILPTGYGKSMIYQLLPRRV